MKYYKKANGGVWAFEDDGSQDDQITDEFTAMTEAEIASHLTPKTVLLTKFTSLEYLDRFTEAEQLAVVGATMSNPAVKLWYDRMAMASYVDITDPRVAAGIDALIAAGLLDAGRKDALLQPLEI
ncbi:hypothetical protein FNL37_1763 [Methylovorus glucosotrophus]|uniref:hypothetical protein n=1 Tax=Methylovorus glucosotrophus TaxID=266009 RepID=UPI0013313CC4|nr:hypothetical protein [Methylovorus glucosotrophus]KAF0844319.1 hypothetical protein FNL37_1763 [Methylovorus glucosotrophus]